KNRQMPPASSRRAIRIGARAPIHSAAVRQEARRSHIAGAIRSASGWTSLLCTTATVPLYGAMPSWWLKRGNGGRHHSPPDLARSAERGASRWPYLPDRGDRDRIADRKSTRLNSSHVKK